MRNLVIVESPAKAKTIKKYLGDGYDVMASMGHIRDLPSSKLGVDVDNNFEPVYTNIKDKEELIEKLQKKAKKSDKVYLATDPDREGEAISWHLAHLLDLPLEDNNRVEFNEITKTGVQNGMEHPRTIDLDLVNAQQARRVLDRIVGYKLSPFLWRKVRKGLSAGRVQSVAVKMIVDREDEVRAFKPQEYYTIDAKMSAKGRVKTFDAKFHGIGGKKTELKSREKTDEILKALESLPFIVSAFKTSTRKRSPMPPFITSTLQQDANRKLGFQSRRTMRAAQDLYEGVEIEGQGAVGLITYMRTDSLRISQDAQEAARDYIGAQYGAEYVPAKPRVYKSRRNSQDAHEAIRPTMVELSPDKVKGSLTSDQYKIYKLVWERFVASQMADALHNVNNADIDAGEYRFKASGYNVKFPGHTAVYAAPSDEDDAGSLLPKMEVGDPVTVKEIAGNQHFTQPPARYSEASLIKALEEKGIGRPSTYAPTISTIISRAYVERDGKILRPTVLGEVTTQLMRDHFTSIVDEDFTAHMEDELDTVEEGKTDWHDILHSFYGGFDETLQKAEKEMEGKRVKIPDEPTDEICELCGRNMVIKMGRFGKFLACPGFPECKNTKPLSKATGGLCPVCGGKMLEKKSKKGRVYYGCEKNPDCPFMSWDEPIKDNCPNCGKTMFKKKGKAGKLYCVGEGCGYEQPLPKA